MNILVSFSLLKIGILIVLFLYGIFAYIIFNQITVMTRILKEQYISVILQVIAGIHLFLVLSLFFLFLVIL